MYIYYFEYNNQKEINNQVFETLGQATHYGQQLGKAFDINGIRHTPNIDEPRPLIFESSKIKVYVMKLIMP